MSQILPLMQVVRDVTVLVAVLQGLMLMMSLLPRHARSPLSPAVSTHSIDRTSSHGAGTTESVAAFRLPDERPRPGSSCPRRPDSPSVRPVEASSSRGAEQSDGDRHTLEGYRADVLEAHTIGSLGDLLADDHLASLSDRCES